MNDPSRFIENEEDLDLMLAVEPPGAAEDAPSTFAKPEAALPGIMSIEEFTEAIEEYKGRVPRLRSEVDRLYAQAAALSAQIAREESESALAELAKTSVAIREAINRSFYVSGVDRATTVNLRNLVGETIRGYVGSTIDDRGKVQLLGITLPEFIDRANMAGAQALTDARLETIYRNNLSAAFTDGERQVLEQPEVRRTIPLLRLFNPQDPRSRETHAAMDGFVATVDQVTAWGLWTPCGHQCRCAWEPVPFAEAARQGWVDADTDEVNLAALAAHNGPRMRLVESGLYPDPGWRSR